MDYPFQLPEAKAVNDFLMAHPNIAGVQSYHNNGGMILRGPGAEWQGEYPRADVRVYDELGRQGERMLPYYRYLVIWSGLYTVHGGFIDWTNDGLGMLSFSNELWNGGQYFNSPELQTAAARSRTARSTTASRQYYFDDYARVRRPVRRVEGVRPSAVRQGRDGRLEEDAGPRAAALHERRAVPPQHGVLALPGRRDAADEGWARRRSRPIGGGVYRVRVDFDQREADADDPRQGGARTTSSAPTCSPSRARASRSSRPAGCASKFRPGATELIDQKDLKRILLRTGHRRAHDAHDRVPRARHGRDDGHLRQRQGWQGDNESRGQVTTVDKWGQTMV